MPRKPPPSSPSSAAAVASADHRRQSAIALKAAFSIAARWGLRDAQLGILLGGVPEPSLRRWKAQLRDSGGIRTELSRDQLDRVSYLLGIYKALHILFPDAGQADGWIHRANTAPAFGGGSALERMLGGGMDDLRMVRRYLDAWRG
ncbi:MAG: MbcA/ParS/Xre antitoxin family protein [Nevskiales bacterium]|nr:MbcA/ParS/Xre antitoxin family protein [Nevskiales bacterium]